MARALSFLGLLLLGLNTLDLTCAQTPSTSTREVHPKLQTWKCTKRGGCVKKNTSIVLDSLAHPVHQLANPNLGCGDWGNPPNKTICPDAETCQKNCIVEGISDYSKYGVVTKGGDLILTQLRADGSVASPRVYLLSEDERKYEMLQLTGGELSFDVDMSKLPCGMNGALYLVEMDKAGGKNKLNKAGAYYGTGYCDAQCFVTPFINGAPNIAGKGSCCGEMDIWEANKMATQLAPHPCNHTGLYECTGAECQFDGVCDKNGCANNPYNQGADPTYYGPGLKVDTKRPFTVVTQFPAVRGQLTEIHRLYIQDGKVIQNAVANVPGLGEMDYMNDAYCAANGATKFMGLGAMKGMGGALSRGMVLAFSIWWDEGGFMNWLDSGASGPCSATEGDPKIIRQIQPDTAVTYSQIKWGEIGSTYKAK